MPTHGKPTVFVSSTIYDFADLRGALKFWLEEGGFEVWMSEYNDLDKLPDANTFDACLESIRRADYYILLIGEKRGSTYDAASGVSITQEEYRTAYAAFADQGHPLPLLFVRADKKHLVDGWARAGGTGEPPFKDAAFVRDFMAEVRRDDEHAGAVKGLGAWPLANWLHAFHAFRDLIDALRVALALRVDVAHARLLSSIRLDLEILLTALLGKHQYRPKREDPGLQTIAAAAASMGEAGEEVLRFLEAQEFDMPHPLQRVLTSVVEAFPLDDAGRGPLRLNKSQTFRLTTYLVTLADPDKLWTQPLRQSLASGALLAFDPASRAFQHTPLSDAVADLVRQAEYYSALYRGSRQLVSEVLGAIITANRARVHFINLQHEQAVSLWALYNSQENLYRRVAALYAFTNGHREQPAPTSLLPTSPFGAEMEERIHRERPSIEDIREWGAMPEAWQVE